MFIVVSLLLVTTALSVVMLLVLSSLSHSGANGIREWTMANATAVFALPLFAGRGVIPDFLSVETANTLLLCTTCAMLAGYRRYLGLAVPWRRLAGCILLGAGLIAVFHHGFDSMAWRIVAMSALHGALCVEMGVIMRRALPQAPRRYPHLFTIGAAWANAAGQLLRALLYGAFAAGFALPVNDTALSIAFFSFGALSLPALTLGAVMIVNADLIARARHAADHDYLTNACSRRAFFELARREQARAHRHRVPLSLLLFDVDHFKRINDTHGHAAGDRVLVEIVERTRAVVRTIDTCGRLGGEEFAVLLPDTPHAMALIVAERLRVGLDRHLQVAGAVHSVPYTVSVGVATLGDGETVEQMLSRADAALYRAKEGGRNMVVAAADATSAGMEELLRRHG